MTPIACVPAPEKSLEVSTRRCLRGEEGFTIIEVLVAAIVLTVGIVALFSAVTSAQKLGSGAEVHQEAIALAQGEIERLHSSEFAQIGLTSTTTPAHSNEEFNPATYVNSAEAHVCTNPQAPSTQQTHCYQWNWSNTSLEEPMVIEGTDATANPRKVAVPVLVKGSTTLLNFEIYRFITWVDDSECGTGCSTSKTTTNEAKRIIVAVKLEGTLKNGTSLDRPAVLESIVDSPHSNEVECKSETQCK